MPRLMQWKEPLVPLMTEVHRMPVRIGQATFFLLLGLCSAAPVQAEPAEDPARARRRTPVVEVYEQCRDAVVNIATTQIVRTPTLDSIFNFGPPRVGRATSIGSGFLVHESGYIVTNAHVVAQATDAQVTFVNKETLPAAIVSVDTEHDLAVLKIDAHQPLPHIKLGRSDDIMIGETVVAIGNPLGLQNSVTSGIISALDRDLQLNEEVTYRGLIQTDAPINPGNSGGPLLNINGELIGINTAIRGDAQSIGFAIPVQRLWELLPALLDIEHRERVRFGLQVAGRDSRVTAVRPDTPAARAGLKTGDRIVKFNGHALRDGIDYDVHLLAEKPDNKIRLAVLRDQKTIDVEVPLEAVPMPDGFKLARERFGLELTEIPPATRRDYGLPQHVGFMVKSVTKNSSAARIGVHANDFLLRLNRNSVTSAQDLALMLEPVETDDNVVIELLRVTRGSPELCVGTLKAH